MGKRPVFPRGLEMHGADITLVTNALARAQSTVAGTETERSFSMSDFLPSSSMFFHFQFVYPSLASRNSRCLVLKRTQSAFIRGLEEYFRLP